MLLSLLDKMDEKLEALFDWAYRRLWLEVAKVSAFHRPSVRPTLEVLEDRLVPAAFTFDGGVGGNGTAWANVQNWLDNGVRANVLPGANDDVTIDPSATCTLSGQSATVQSLTVFGTLNVQNTLTVEANGNSGSGTTLVSNAWPLSGAGTMVVGSSDSQTDAKLETNTLNDNGIVTVGGSTAVGSSADIDAVFLNLGNSTSGDSGILNIGDPNAGHAGSVDVSNSMVVNYCSSLNVGGVNNSGGTLDVVSFGSAGTVLVNTNGEMDVKSGAGFGGTLTVAGGEIKAENINDTQGAGVTFFGTSSPVIVSGTGKLVAEINASFTVGAGSTLTLMPDSAVGSALNEGQFIIDGSLVVNTNLTPNGDITLNNDGGNTFAGSITGTGSIDEWHEFTWNGGPVSLTGGITIEPQAEWRLAGAAPKTLGCNVTSLNMDTQFGGTGILTILAGNTFTNASGTVAMSLPSIIGGGTFINAAGATVQISSPAPSGLLISAILDNEGALDCETGAGPLDLEDISGSSLLNGKLSLNNDSLTIGGVYTTTIGFNEDWSPSDLTTLTGMLTIASGASADFDHMVLTTPSSGSGGVITGPGDFSIGASGGNTGDYLTWMGGTMSGTGTTTIGPYATLTIGSGAQGGICSTAAPLTITDSCRGSLR